MKIGLRYNYEERIILKIVLKYFPAHKIYYPVFQKCRIFVATKTIFVVRDG